MNKLYHAKQSVTTFKRNNYCPDVQKELKYLPRDIERNLGMGTNILDYQSWLGKYPFRWRIQNKATKFWWWRRVL